jgi:5-methyltetrahydrofolate--homocysteine methyltransferase
MKSISEAIIEGEVDTALEQTKAGLKSGLKAEEILNQGLIPAMGEVGKLFETGKYFLPEMLVAAHAMKGCLQILRPLLTESDVAPVGKVVIGTVQGDLHDIGKNLVGMMLEGAGFAVVDLGTDVTPQQFIDAVEEIKPDIVAMSALLSTTMIQFKVTINALKEAGALGSVKVMVGGAPITADYAKEVGADGYAADASQASSLAMKLIA